MPSGTAKIAARTKPPTTRQIVIPMSFTKPCATNRSSPSRTIVSGSARNVFGTKPPSVATAHSATKITKNAVPSTSWRRREIGFSGVIACACRRQFACALLDEARVDQRVEIRHALDAAHLEQQVRRVLAERLDLAVEELLVRSFVLPAQVLRRIRELLAGLLDDRTHDFGGLLVVLVNHVQRFEVAVHH